MIKAVIIEDETLAANRLEALVKKCDDSIEIIAKIPSVKAAVQWFQQHPPPDLVFMDIHLEDGSGFAIFDQTDVAAPVIFTTAYDEYAIKAFKFNSIDYLLKPINLEELAHALEQFRKLKLSSYHYSEKGDASIENLKKTTLKSRFLVTSGSKLLSIPVAEVAYFYSEDKITFLQTFKNNRYAIEYSLDKLTAMLQPEQYFKINRQLIVNIKSIANVYKVSINRLKITLAPEYNKDIFVSVEKYSAFKDWLDA